MKETQMAKVVIDPVTSGYSLSKINANLETLAAELNDKVLYRDNPLGEPNSLSNDVDMNSNDILNVKNLNGIDISGLSDLADVIGYAEEWANNPEDLLVSTEAGGDGVDDYSSLHHAAKASADATLTAADVVTTNADVVSTNADVVSTHADVVLTNADVTYTTEWANKAEDSLISAAAGGDEVDDYSALHWARKAEASVSGNLLASTLIHNMTSDADYTLSADENLNGRAVITDTSVNLTTARNIIISVIE